MRRESSLKERFLAALWSVLGLILVFGVVILMNSEGWEEPKKKEKLASQFDVQKVAKPKPRPKPKPKPKPKKPKPNRATPTPNLSSQLSGIDTGLESFMAGDFIDEDALLGDASKDMVMTDDTVDVAPQPTRRSPLEYPKKARKLGVTGHVLMNLLINKTGKVERVKVLESQPVGTFDAVAVAAVKSWEFKPAEYQGKAVKVWAKQKIRFDLD